MVDAGTDATTPHARVPEAPRQPPRNNPPMLSFIIPARTSPDLTTACLNSIVSSVGTLGLAPLCEFVLIDDNSDPRWGLAPLFREFRQVTGSPCHIARFKTWQHYTGVFAYGLSAAKGEHVFFISNDMQVTPSWLKTILAVAHVHPDAGIVRGVANLVDSHPEHDYLPPFEPRTYDDITAFSDLIAKAHGMITHEDEVLSGDAVYIRRALINAIGVLDRQFFGYFGDPDYGLRARRAGFRLLCAKGAWLYHFGQGHIKAEAQVTNTTLDEQALKRRAMVLEQYEKFKRKWQGARIPETYCNVKEFDIPSLLALPRPASFNYVAPIPLPSPEVELL